MKQVDEIIALDGMLCFDIYAAHHAFGQVYKSLLDPLGLTYPQYLVLLLLWAGDDQTVGGIGRQLGLESSTLTPLIKRMEKNGLLLRKRDAADERRVRVSLSDKGKGLEADAAEIPSCIAKASGLSISEFRLMHDMLFKTRRALLAGGD